MRLGEINGTASRQGGLPARSAEREAGAPAVESRALVALSPAASTREAMTNYRQAPFLAHLLAMKGQHPQTRERRRAEPHEALAAYRATVALTGRN